MTDDPVVARIQLGILLRELREDADHTAAEACRHLGCSAGKMSQVENGKQGMPIEQVAALLDFYRADDTASAEALRLAAVPWPRRRRRRRALYQEAIPRTTRRYVALEADASEIVAYDNAVINGLLQTEGYARALLRSGAPYAGSQEINAKLEIRLNRQRGLTREVDPLRLDVIIDEACLHRMIGGREVMAGQLRHLLDMSERENVRLQVLPFEPKATPNQDEYFVACSNFHILKLSERGSLVYIEDFAGGTYPEDILVIQEYAAAFERLRAAADDQDDSQALLAKVVTKYE
ncbi:transcriptional regulator [Amycolatopsis antarctica]|uniref:Transcriptional regulator n=1 Tax=Amycolatopsis antarctica TaxID=1854586 RepID=A0A263DAR8_9PSEU|nr:transcriptional regulator [Amycolatopsis antarctica]